MITPCTFLGDHIGDRFSTIFGDKYILTSLNSMRNMEGNENSRTNKNVAVLARNHEINFNGNYTVRLASRKLSTGDTYNLIETLGVYNYDPERQVLISHHGVVRDEERKCYCFGALQTPFNQMKNPISPEELASIFNREHKEHMDNRFTHLTRSSTIAFAPVYDNHLNNAIAFRPKPEDIFKCGRTPKGTKRKCGYYGLEVNQHQKIDSYTVGLSSWKIAPNERGDKEGIPGLSCFQPH